MKKSSAVVLIFAGWALAQSVDQLLALLANTPKLRVKGEPYKLPMALGIVSSVADDGKGLLYVLQRGPENDPVIVLNREGHVVRSWGKGLYNIPHTVRLDPEGNVWTVDAGSSMVLKFSPDGRKLAEIAVGEVPQGRAGGFYGTTDIAFVPGGRIFISDGYGNARILEYNAQGKRVHQWGEHGKAPGQFDTPHGIAFDGRNTLFVADRGNNRIQSFDLNGKFLSEWTHVGKPYSLRYIGGFLYAGVQRPDQTSVAGPARRPPGWLLKIDPSNGKVLGQVESAGAHHFIEVTPNGELYGGSMPDGFTWFR
jgi:DNA-binding beta-propeller fold protein YncE